MIPGWSITQMNHVRMWADSTPAEVLARQVRKPKDEVEQIIVRLNVKPAKPVNPEPRRMDGRKPLWTKDKDAVVIAEYPTTDTVVLARKLGVTPNALMKRASSLNVGKHPGHPTHSFWNPEREEMLAEMWPHAPMEKVQKALGCSRTLLYAKAKDMGLKRPSKIRSAVNHLRRGDHITALGIIEEILK